MVTATISKNLISQIDKLPYDLQLRVLDFAKALTPKGIKGKDILRFSGAINPDDLGLMSNAIENKIGRAHV